MTQPDELSSMDLVTDLTTTGVDADLDRAVQAADAAAQAAGRVGARARRPRPSWTAVVGLYATIWGRADNPPVTLELLRALTKAGNYVGGAFDGGRLVGACVGFFHAPAEDALHSHIAGVVAERDRPQRRLRAQAAPARLGAAARGLRDRLDLRPAGQPQRLLQPGQAGAPRRPSTCRTSTAPMLDTINGADDSDRLLVRWRLRDPAVVAACAGGSAGAIVADELAAGAVVALGVGRGRRARCRADSTARPSLVAVPRDIEALRAADPALAQQLAGRGARGARARCSPTAAGSTGFDRAGWYVVHGGDR